MLSLFIIIIIVTVIVLPSKDVDVLTTNLAFVGKQ